MAEAPCTPEGLSVTLSYQQPRHRDGLGLLYTGQMEIEHLTLETLEKQLRYERERNDRLLQANQKLMIRSVQQQGEIDNLHCYLSYYLQNNKPVEKAN